MKAQLYSTKEKQPQFERKVSHIGLQTEIQTQLSQRQERKLNHKQFLVLKQFV